MLWHLILRVHLTTANIETHNNDTKAENILRIVLQFAFILLRCKLPQFRKMFPLYNSV